jgi:hypothetical protein
VATFKPTANGDNVTWNQLAQFYNNVENSWIGKPASASWWKSSLRFPSVTVPKNATIDTAKITFDAHANWTGEVNAIIYGNDVDDAVAPTNLTEAGALVSTTASAAWSDIAEWVVDSDYDTPSLVTIVQEIVDRSGWASGQAMQFMIYDNGSAENAGRGYHNYKESADLCPILTITYHTQWVNKINTVSTPAKIYGVANASDNYKVNKVNTVGR